jgi:hypothetical protein
VGEQTYLVRYGVMSHVGRFPAFPVNDSAFERGQLVVLQTDRGVELGEVLIAVDPKPAAAKHAVEDTTARPGGAVSDQSVGASGPHVLRAAGPDDLSLSKRADEARVSRFALCQRILQEGNWPWELIDVEPLLDGRSTIIHYLGPHQIDFATLRARFRIECDMEVTLEPVGTDPDSQHSDDEADLEASGGGCGSCGCSDGGGCGTRPAATIDDHAHMGKPAVNGCAPHSHSGCSSCGIGKLLADRSRAEA